MLGWCGLYIHMYAIVWNHDDILTVLLLQWHIYLTLPNSPHTGIRMYNYNTWSVPGKYSSQSFLDLNILSKLTLHCDCVSGVQCGVSVTYSSTQVCGLKGASVVLPCKYYYSKVGYYIGGEWYEEKKGRVREQSDSDNRDCSLKIDKLSNDHSGVYHFRFYTALQTRWITGRSGVSVSVTRNDEHILLTICLLFSNHNGNYIQGWSHNAF